MANVTERVAPYLVIEHVITKNVSTLSVAFFLYGVYFIVFGLSVHVLSRPNSPASKLYMGLTVALFVLATIYTVLEAWGLSRQATIEFNAASTKNYTPLIKYLTHDLGSICWDAITSIISTLMNAMADTMLIHRCYVVWNFNKFVLYPFAFVAFVLNSMDLGCNITYIIGHTSNSKASFNTNLVIKSSSIDHGVLIGIIVLQLGLAFMTGGRIWWISRQVRHQMGPSTDAQYRAVVAIVIESGFLYASSLLAFSIMQESGIAGITPFAFGFITVLMSGIAPTLIIARVAYVGKSIDNVQQMVSSLHFADTQENHRKFITARASFSLQLPGARSIVGVPVEVDEQLVLPAAGEKMA